MKAAIVAILCAPFLLAIPSQAQSASVWTVFKDTSGTEITADKTTGKYNIQAGQDLTAEVWFTADTAWTSSKLQFGYGTASSENGGDNDGHFTLFAIQMNDAASLALSFPFLGGFASSEPGDRPYGLKGDLVPISGAAANQYEHAVFLLHNNMALGHEGNISIYNSQIDTMSAPNITYQMNTIPEPSSLMAMGCAGVGVLGNLLHRRRKKIAAKS